MSATNWVSCRPEDDAESFTERSAERRQVFEDAARRLPTAELSPLVWAFLQVGDLEQVKDITHSRVSWKTVKDDRESLFDYEAKDAVLLWKQKQHPVAKNTAKTDATPGSKRSFSGAFPNHSPSSPLRPRAATPTSPLRPQAATPTFETRTRSGKPLGGREFSPSRVRGIADRCKERDHGRCVVSRIGAVDACHIYPWCAFGGKTPERVRNFWGILRMFWAEDKVDGWYAKVFQDDRDEEPKGTETIENMLTLTATLHRFHSEGAFALRPVRMSDDKTQLELEFHWLARQERDPSVKVDLLEEPLSSRDRKDSGNDYEFSRYGDANPTPLVSGTKFTMTTDDATTKPLPDPGLLELQWHLQRILAMSGAAGWKEEDFDHDGPGTGVLAPAFVTQGLDEQPAEYCRSRSSSPSESVESVDGAYE